MRCPYCKHNETKVTNKRDHEDLSRRRRECLKCGKRFTTHEKVEPIERSVIKKDGRRERFDRDKLFLGIVKACEKRDVGHDVVENVVRDIENKLVAKNKETPTDKIGETVMKKLKKIDNVAYIRFASVYRDFRDLGDFKDVMRGL